MTPNMISAGYNHVKTPVFMMQNDHYVAQTTHNTKDTDKVHGRLYTGGAFSSIALLFRSHTHPFSLLLVTHN